MRFLADELDGCSCDEEFLATFWASTRRDGESSVQYLAICRRIEPGGDGSVQAERDDQSWTADDPVLRATLHADHLDIELTAKGQADLGLRDPSIRVDFRPRPIRELWELRKALAVIFLGHPGYREHLAALG